MSQNKTKTQQEEQELPTLIKGQKSYKDFEICRAIYGEIASGDAGKNQFKTVKALRKNAEIVPQDVCPFDCEGFTMIREKIPTDSNGNFLTNKENQKYVEDGKNWDVGYVISNEFLNL